MTCGVSLALQAWSHGCGGPSRRFPSTQLRAALPSSAAHRLSASGGSNLQLIFTANSRTDAAPPPRRSLVGRDVSTSNPGSEPGRHRIRHDHPGPAATQHHQTCRLKDPSSLQGSAPAAAAMPRLRDVRGLPVLLSVIEQYVGEWHRRGMWPDMVAAFSALGKVGTPSGGDPELRRRTLAAFHTLAAAYLPLVPRLRAAKAFIVPLWACASLGCWDDGLAAALLRQLPRSRCSSGHSPDAGAEIDSGGIPQPASQPRATGLFPPGPGADTLLQTSTPRGHANLWWAVSRSPPDVAVLAGPALRDSAACLLRLGTQQLRAQDCSNVLLACARLRWREAPALLDHLAGCLAALPAANCQDLANALYALGELAEDCGHQPRRADLHSMAERIALRLAARQLEREVVPNQVGEPGLEPEPETIPQPRSEPQGNAGKVGDRDAERHAGGSFSPQHLANMLLGCAKLGYRGPKLLAPLAAAAGRAAPALKQQELFNSLHALAKLGCTGQPYTRVAQRLCDEAHARLLRAPDRLVAQDLANMLIALESLRPAHRMEYAEAVAAECLRRRFAGFRLQDLSIAVWALGKLDWAADQGWYAAAVQAAVRRGRMAGAKAQIWSNLLYGLASVRHRPNDDLLRAMTAAGRHGPLAALRAGAKSQECVNLLWALAVLGLYEERLVDALVARLGELLMLQQQQHQHQQDGERERVGMSLGGQGLANSLWALAVMGPKVLRRHRGLVEELLRECSMLLEGMGTSGLGCEEAALCFAEKGLPQLWQVQLELQHMSGGGCGHLRGVLGQAGGTPAARLPAAVAGRLGKRPLVSPLQDSVARALERLRGQQWHAAALSGAAEWTTGAGGSALLPPGGGAGAGGVVSVAQEYEVEGVYCRVDVLVELAGGRRVAVEVDGPSHFLANEPHCWTKNGRTRLRDRQLERVFGAGNVVSVPYWEWVGLRSEAQRREYLCGLLGLAEAAV